MQILETSIHNRSGFSTDFFHTLIKQRQKTDVSSPHPTLSYHGGTGCDGWECKKSAETQQAS
ncbi:hypothetical protein QUA81_31010 [Microcoleus sp. F6_B4]